MNCATCGTALVNGGSCTVCNPWQTPAAGSPQAGVYAAGPAPVPKAWQRLVDKRPAEAIDMAYAFKLSVVFTIAQVAALALISIVNFAMAQSTSLGNTSLIFFLAIFPLVAVRLAGGSVSGWLGGAVSNLKLRPDIGLGWLFALPTVKRMLTASMVYTYAFLLFVIVRITQHPDTLSGYHMWLDITGVVYLLAAVFQGVNFTAFAVPTYRLVCARLAVPLPPGMYAPIPAQGSVAPIAAE